MKSMMMDGTYGFSYIEPVNGGKPDLTRMEDDSKLRLDGRGWFGRGVAGGLVVGGGGKDR